MQPNLNDVKVDFGVRVRTNAASAAFGAACMLYYGFLVSGTPNVTGLFSAGDAVFVWTLRIGGVLLMLVAAFSLTGMLAALMADAIVSGSIGLLLIASALMMMADGGRGINQLLFIVFGVMYASAGFRNGRDFMLLGRLCREVADTPNPTHIPEPVAPMAPPTASIEQETLVKATVGSLASELRRRKTEPIDQPTDDPYASEEPAQDDFAVGEITEDDYAASEIMDAAPFDHDPQGDAILEDTPEVDPLPDDPPADGFLSSFADEDSPRGL